MSSYAQWAIEMVRHFFGTQSCGQRVRLMVTRDMLDQNFPNLGGTTGFLSAVLEGPKGVNNDDVTMRSRGLRLHKMWRKHAPGLKPEFAQLSAMDDAPPFLPYLCLLCLAWTEGDETLAANAYYNRLNQLYPNNELHNRLGDWHTLWEGLELWTKGVKGHRRGVFEVEILGGCRHVGVPRSQVIFTPAKIDHLPELFFQCSLESGSVLYLDRLRELVLVHSPVTEPLLGHTLFSEIKKQTPLGSSALQALLEHFENWDGEVPERETSGGNGGNASVPSAISLALQPMADNTRWMATFVTFQGNLCEQLAFRTRAWKLRMIAETYAEFCGADGVAVDATTYPSSWTSGYLVNGEQDADEGERREVAFNLSGKQVRIFDRWVGQPPHLVECKTLPTVGPAYVLVHDDSKNEWTQFRNLCRPTIQIQDVTWSGLPTGQQLFCLPDVSTLQPQALSVLPGGLAVSASRSRALRLVAGTRCNTGTARRAYAEYDPPVLVVEGPPGAALVVSGARATGIDTPSVPHGMQGNTVRTYSLTVETDEPAVVARLEHGGRQLGVVAFGVHRDQLGTEPTGPVSRFDFLGNMSDGDGAEGLIVPGQSSPWQFEDGVCNLGVPLTDSVWESPAVQFIEALSLHDGRLPYPEYKRRAVQIAKSEPWRLSDETQWLSQLGFIDLHVDSRGRWSHVTPLPLQLYPLPWLSAGRYQFVLAGTAAIKRLKEVVTLAHDLLECDVRIVSNHFRAIPPRITFLHKEMAAGQQLATEMGLLWSPQPPGNQFAAWAGGLDDWLQTITWFPDPGPHPSAEYSPEEFRFLPNRQFAAPWHLRRFVDPYTAQKWHCLYQSKSHTHCERHAYVRDFTWAMWRVHMVLPEDDVTNLAYDKETARLIVPCQLNFPYLLGRALATCSGLPPAALYACAPYMDRAAGILLPDASPYPGLCAVYQHVPRPIAEKIAAKLSARLVDVSF